MSHEATKRRVGRWLAEWRKRLLLNEWHIDVCYPNESAEGAEAGSSILATNLVNVPYLLMSISIYPEFFDQDRRTQEATIVHELVHAIVQPLWDIVQNQHAGALITPRAQRETMEQLTQRVTNVALGRAGA